MLRGRRGGVAMREGGWGYRYPICRQKLRDVVSSENSPDGLYCAVISCQSGVVVAQTRKTPDGTY